MKVTCTSYKETETFYIVQTNVGEFIKKKAKRSQWIEVETARPANTSVCSAIDDYTTKISLDKYYANVVEEYRRSKMF